MNKGAGGACAVGGEAVRAVLCSLLVVTSCSCMPDLHSRQQNMR
jgi:hypothetical protein